MTKFEKIIKGLEQHMKTECLSERKQLQPVICPYFQEYDCIAELCRDALELVEEREAQPAIIEGSDVIRIGRCPSCKTVLQPWGANYCYNCGQAVKWND